MMNTVEIKMMKSIVLFSLINAFYLILSKNNYAFRLKCAKLTPISKSKISLHSMCGIELRLNT